MNAHLLTISIGPVQEFISAARRTRDLWFGSRLLSEISRAVATTVEKHGNLIFPASLLAQNVANVILIELKAGADPRVVAAEAQGAAHDYWLTFAKEAHHEASMVIRTDTWNDQVEDVIEYYAAWAPRSPDYRADRARVMRLLAGRKNCRDFCQASQLDGGLPKSSLDGQRATVLEGPKPGEKQATYRNKWPKEIRRKLRVRSGEQLDAIGVVKRVGEGVKRYPSVSRIAADVWIRGIRKSGGADVLCRFAEYCGSLPRDVVHRLDEFPQFKDFPYEGTTLFRTRHHEWWEEADDVPEDAAQRKEPPEWYAGLDGELSAVEEFAAKCRIGKEPEPYLAVLVADGDRMGEAISALDSVEKNQAFSQALADFAGKAQELVEKHNGVLVYAGGDDVLAFVPVDKCLECARELHVCFGKLMEEWSKDAPNPLTLSVGVAIGHFMDNLEDLLEYGRAAEQHAKRPDRDGLAVHLHKRGGAPITVRAKWAAKPYERITRYAQLIQDEAIPIKLPYDLRRLADVYGGWPAETEDQKKTAADAMRKDVIRVIRDKQPRSGGHMPEIETAVAKRVTHAASLHHFAQELLIARQIATALGQAGERPTPIKEVAI
jgi:CRISPR-associated protein Cmr2